MYSKKKIEEKCYELNPSLKEDGLSITVIEEPKKGGHTIAIYKEINKAPTKEIFLDHIVAEACFKQDDCQRWKQLLEFE